MLKNHTNKLGRKHGAIKHAETRKRIELDEENNEVNFAVDIKQDRGDDRMSTIDYKLIRKFLKSRVDQPWAEVHEGICTRITDLQQRKAALEEVDENTHVDEAGQIIIRGRRGIETLESFTGFYVDPQTKSLKHKSREPKGPRWTYKQDGLLTPEGLFVRKENLWFVLPLDHLKAHEPTATELRQAGITCATYSSGLGVGCETYVRKDHHRITVQKTEETAKINNYNYKNLEVLVERKHLQQLNHEELNRLLKKYPDANEVICNIGERRNF